MHAVLMIVVFACSSNEIGVAVQMGDGDLDI
jgi:hypothetical protein